MFKNFSFLVLAVVFAAGCGIKAETYVMTKERVDIEQAAGNNAGYIIGTAKYQEPEKKTRKTYVLEISKPVPETEAKKIEETVSKTAVEQNTQNTEETPPSQPAVFSLQGLNIPPIEDVGASPSASGPKEDVSYTVQKDDTLQKIAKKFYGTYSRWIKIYEANKDQLKNPNFVKPGTVITIPAGQ